MYIENNVKLMFKQNTADATGSVTPTPSLRFLNDIIIACIKSNFKVSQIHGLKVIFAKNSVHD